jgi:hypothetical protein
MVVYTKMTAASGGFHLRKSSTHLIRNRGGRTFKSSCMPKPNYIGKQGNAFKDYSPWRFNGASVICLVS